MLLEQFFVNFSILYTVVFLLHHFFSKTNILSTSPFKGKILVGVLQGVFGVLLMHFGIHLEGGAIIDLRIIPMMISAQVGGLSSLLISTAIIIVGRFFLFPITDSTIINIIVLALSAVAFSIISTSNIKKERKWFLMVVSFLFIMGGSIHFVISDIKKGLTIFFQYGISIILATFATHLLTFYLWRNSENYDKLQHLAFKDYLTGLNNTRSFYNEINNAFSRVIEKQEELALMMIDIDNFKKVNDTYGHATGDEVIKQLSNILLSSCRTSDIISRIGGEEFSVIMPDSDFFISLSIAEKIRQTVEQTPFVINESLKLNITVSIGYSTTKQKDIISVSDLINLSDKKLYQSKHSGKNRISS